MKNPFNTLFGRLALMTVGLIVLVHVTLLIIVDWERGQLDATHTQHAVQLAVQAEHDGVLAASSVAATLGVTYVPADKAIQYGCPVPCTNTYTPFDRDLRRKLPPGSQVTFDTDNGTVWVRYAGNPDWVKLQNAALPGRRFLSASLLMLALAVIIALIGIVNTLMLSVFERTREIGLLRAVGMRRRQVRTMIRSEAVILAIFGAVIGIIIGTGMGLALVSSLKNQGITDTVVPYSNLVIFLILAALLGLVAASWPARRAAKLDVLAAIAAQ